MPLSPPDDRKRLHTRKIEFRGYERADGRFDIEGRITDAKTYGFDNQDREGIKAGEFHKVSPKDTSLAFHGMLNSTIYVWILQAGPKESLVDKGEWLGALFLGGIGTAPTET